MSPSTFILKFIQRYPSQVLSTIILGFSGAVFNGVSTTLIVPILLSFLGQTVDLKGAPPLIEKIINPFQGWPEDQRLPLLLGAVVLLIILKNLASYLSVLMSGYLTRSMTRDLRKKGVKILLEVDLSFYVNNRIGDLTNRLGGEVARTATAVSTFIKLIITGITILVFLVLLLSISWQLTLASTLVLGFVVLINQSIISRAKAFGQQLSDASRLYSIGILEILNGIRLVKAVCNEEKEYEHLKQLIDQREKIDFQSQANSAAIGPLNEVASIIALIAIVLIGRIFFASNLQTFSALLLTYLLVLFRLLPFVSQLNTQRGQFANAAAGLVVVYDLLRRDDKPFMVNGSASFKSMQEGIRFNRLSFAYPGSAEPVLKEVDLFLPKGTTLAIVGASGAGKSTLADLLARFYDPTAGSIAIDGQDLREFDLHSLREAMGIVSQDTFLFNDSLRNNIAYGRAGTTETEVITALKRANLYDFVEQLPQGLDTTIGDRGVMLSGGQRQRIAIARALLKNPEILILDEATSALDTVSEQMVQAAIDNLSRDRTTLVIAHRLSTVQRANQIAVLDKGQVVEVGTHEELLQQGSYYKRLYAIQFAAEAQIPIPKSTIPTETLTNASYQVRNYMNSVLGYFNLVSSGMVEDQEERFELTEEAYQATIELLKTLEVIEKSIKN
ncbi:ABC transporter ATP-binding protein [Leptolyngbya sp. 'hensonii']|uniref:ABC transporter ATP-binding protein n=1 Tax=Leptolyngbya sp. 'hensonii' TaxID=1922337 RepID=UPI00094F5120|nr:ABC transporter ATP-binding protein [Leptolyngbya sp. 'hensonii']OLP17553.1 ABC transporter ATP-binding protein [Leptolyngbya sp. 'hensonii']